MEAYCSRQGMPSAAVRFLYDGERLRVRRDRGSVAWEDAGLYYSASDKFISLLQEDATPASLDMQDQDVIDAVAQQTGGRGN